MKVKSERLFPATEVTARCHVCEWSGDAVWVREGRQVRAAARRHVAQTGHRVSVHVERLSTTEMSPV